MTLVIPEETLTSHIAVLGKAGSGKTYAIRAVVEWLLKIHRRVCVVDPTGVWWGLRLDKDGKRRGFDVVIFGGRHGDLPLTEHQGAAVAEIVATSSTPVIIDTSLMTVGARTRFFGDFGETLLRKNSGPLHLVIDEAHLFAPQGRVADPQSGKMLHATNNLISLGRARGLRVVMITQRPAKLHKDSLTQAETLIAMRLIAPQDRAAIKDWIGEWVDDQQPSVPRIMQSLPSLKTGTGWVWAPMLNILSETKFPKIGTFDSSATPDEGSDETRALPAIDLDRVGAQMQTIAAEAKASDPAELKRRIADLEGQLAEAATATAAPENIDADLKAAEQRGERAGFERGWREGANAEFKGWERHITGMCGQLRTMADDTVVLLQKRASGPPDHAPDFELFGLPDHLKGAKVVLTERRPLGRGIADLVRDAPQRPAGVLAGTVDGAGLGAGERATLAAIIQLRHGRGTTRESLTVVTGYKKTSRNTYLQRLSAKGLISVEGDLITATAEGRKALPDVGRLPVGKALRDHYLKTLGGGEQRIADLLFQAYPNPISRDLIGERTGYSKTSRNTYIQRLQARGLVVAERDGVRAHADLFE